MNSAIEIVGSAIFVRNVIEKIKEKFPKLSGMVITILSLIFNFLVMFALSLADALINGQHLSTSLIKALAAMIVSSIYHDWKDKNGTQLYFAQPVDQSAPTSTITGTPATAVEGEKVAPPSGLA